jgi:hypothetical protein
MKLKEILLRKLDSLLNPKFENKVIISFLSLGSLLVVVPSIIAYTATFSVENEGTSFIAEINNTPDIFITTLGVICLATSVYFNYRKINREDYTEKKENSRTVSCQTFNNSTIHSDVPSFSTEKVAVYAMIEGTTTSKLPRERKLMITLFSNFGFSKESSFLRRISLSFICT